MNTNSGDNMKNYSIWQENIKRREYPTLCENKTVDVLIIGGGLTGISTLYHLKSSKLKVMLVEQGQIGMSTTSRSTGKLSFLQNDLLDKIRTSFDDKIAKKYVDSQIEAIKLIKKLCEKEAIECDLKIANSKLYTQEEKEIKYLDNLSNFLKKCKVKVIKSSSTLVDSKYMIEVEGTYLFHPLKFLYGLANNFSNIYENTAIKKITKVKNQYYCYTDNNVIKTKYVVLASHYPYFNLPFVFPLKAHLEKSYLSASTYNPKSDSQISLISYSNPFVSIRNYNNYLIYLSNSHIISEAPRDKKHFNELIKKVNDLKLNPEYLWSNTDIITNDGLPYIGKIDDNLLIGTGYNTWGLASSVLAGKILSDIILNKKNDYIDLFDPKRSNLEQIIGGFNSVYRSISGYVQGITKSKSKLSCTHIGCKLIYNEIEKTYDCPCHGSRFDINGRVIMAPANNSIECVKEKK